MKYAIPLTEQDIERLNCVYKTHLNHRVRQRSHAISSAIKATKFPASVDFLAPILTGLAHGLTSGVVKVSQDYMINHAVGGR